MASEETTEAPPEDMVFDNRPPCHLPIPETPWTVQRGSGKQSNPPLLMETADDDVGFCIPPSQLEPKPRTSREMARGGPRPQWPIRTDREQKVVVSYQAQDTPEGKRVFRGRWGNHFGAGRKGDDGGKQFHAGIDLPAEDGDVVQAMEDGEVLATLPFHHGSYAVYVKNDSGIIVNYGEVEKNSWWDFGIQSGVKTGQRVKAGQPIARIGVMEEGSSMLHLETFKGDTDIEDIRKGEMQWEPDKPAPDKLLDPSRYLVRAQHGWFDDMMEKA